MFFAAHVRSGLSPVWEDSARSLGLTQASYPGALGALISELVQVMAIISVTILIITIFPSIRQRSSFLLLFGCPTRHVGS